jgi:hypothetical protein
MEGTTKKSRTKYFIFFAISLAACIGILMSNQCQWFWVTLPFVGTSLALAFDVI